MNSTKPPTTSFLGRSNRMLRPSIRQLRITASGVLAVTLSTTISDAPLSRIVESVTPKACLGDQSDHAICQSGIAVHPDSAMCVVRLLWRCRVRALKVLEFFKLLALLGEILRDTIPEFQRPAKTKTYNRRDSQMVTHSSTSRPVQCLCMAERTGCPVLTDLWSYVLHSLGIQYNS
jgi:hypothetical protein